VSPVPQHPALFSGRFADGHSAISSGLIFLNSSAREAGVNMLLTINSRVAARNADYERRHRRPGALRVGVSSALSRDGGRAALPSPAISCESRYESEQETEAHGARQAGRSRK
jgi:hypothetical protein